MANTSWASPTLYFASTVATFRSWISTWESALSTVGLVQTSDTGQINSATVNFPSANSTAGYSIWRFNDTLQSTEPLFLRFDFGISSNSGYGRMWVSVGTGTNGAGVMTGTGIYGPWQVQFGTSGVQNPTGASTYMACDGSGLVIAQMIESNDSNTRAILVVDRFRDTSGTAVGKGTFVLLRNPIAGSSAYYWILDHTRTYPAGTGVTSLGGGLAPAPNPVTAGTSMAVGSDIITYPMIGAVPEPGISKMLLAYSYADLASGNTQAVTHLGASRTYKAWGSNLTGFDIAGQAAFGALTWWSD